MRIALINAGSVVSGELANPLIEAEAIIFDDGKIHLGGRDEIGDADLRVDLGGATVMPGLFDTHLHPSLNDFTERQDALGYISRSVAGGVTSFISAGECHVPGRPLDGPGAKALAIAAHKVFTGFRPNGAKVHAGAVLLEPGLTREDFNEMANEGVWLVGEIGLSRVYEPPEATEMTAWAHEAGFTAIMHTGGASIPGSSTIGASHVKNIGPDVAAHLNGGPTSLSEDEITEIVGSTSVALEIISNGNPRSALFVLQKAQEADAEDRLILGNDMPSGVGVTPLGIIRTVAYLSAVGGVAPERAIAYGTGNAARAFKRPQGRIAEGAPADVVVIDAPRGSTGKDALEALRRGDHPSIRLVFIDGELRVNESHITARAEREIVLKSRASNGS